MKKGFGVVKKIIDGLDGPTVVFSVCDNIDTDVDRQEKSFDREFLVKPLEGIEYDGRLIPFDCTKKDVIDILGEPEMMGNSYYYFNDELRLDFDKKGKLEFIEFLGGIEGGVQAIIYGVSAFQGTADELYKVLHEKNNGKVIDEENSYSYIFLEISVGVYRESTPDDLVEMEENMSTEELEYEKKKVEHFATLGIGKAGYYS